MSNSIVEVKDLKKYYKDIKAVDGISFDVKEGELIALLGLNGAGKSTTINILSGIADMDSGRVVINGFDISKENTLAKKHIGIVFQHSVLDDTLSVKENLMCRAALYGINKSAFEKRIEELCRLLDFGDLLRRKYGKLSGGQRRKVDIARGLINHPKLLILDEPTTGLDPRTRMDVWGAIEHLRAELKMTIILTTHYMEEANRASNVLIIDKGKILASSSPNELKKKYTSNILKIYGRTNSAWEGAINSLNYPFSYKEDHYEVFLEDSKFAWELLNIQPDMAKDFELIKGDMDMVFLNITGKKLSEVA